jgi:hypothetical protein
LFESLGISFVTMESLVIEGKHTQLVDLKMFLKADQLLALVVNSSVQKMPKKEEAPFKVYIRVGRLICEERADCKSIVMNKRAGLICFLNYRRCAARFVTTSYNFPVTDRLCQ